MTLATAALIVFALAVVTWAMWKGGPPDAADHQLLIMRDGTQARLAGGRARLRAGRGDGGFAGGGGGGDGGGGGCGGDGGGCS